MLQRAIIQKNDDIYFQVPLIDIIGYLVDDELKEQVICHLFSLHSEYTADDTYQSHNWIQFEDIIKHIDKQPKALSCLFSMIPEVHRLNFCTRNKVSFNTLL